MASSTDKVAKIAHGLENNDVVMFAGASLPAALNNYTKYYIINKAADTFEVSLAYGGAKIDFAQDGSGTFTMQGIEVDEIIYASGGVSDYPKENESFVGASISMTVKYRTAVGNPYIQ